MDFINKIVKGYGNLIKSCSKNIITTIKVVLFLLFVFALSVLIVYPLWYIATTSPNTYTFFVVTTFLILFIAYLIYKIVITIKSNGLKNAFIKIYLPKVKKLFFIVFVISLILLTVYIYTFSMIFGIVISFFVLLFFGFAKFVYKS